MNFSCFPGCSTETRHTGANSNVANRDISPCACEWDLKRSMTSLGNVHLGCAAGKIAEDLNLETYDLICMLVI